MGSEVSGALLSNAHRTGEDWDAQLGGPRPGLSGRVWPTCVSNWASAAGRTCRSLPGVPRRASPSSWA